MIDTLYQQVHFWQKYAVNWLDRLSPAEYLSLIFVAASLGAIWKARFGQHKIR